MRYKNILLTGCSGKLGKAIVKSGCFPNLLTPSSKILDITKPHTIKKFFDKNDFDVIIHCAALARMLECELKPDKAIETNIIGTSNLVIEVLRKEAKSKRKIRFVHISTDGVYPGIKGNYSEKDETIPYNKYGWTKLGGECVVNLLPNFCIMRTSFFDPNDIKFDKSANDAYSSKMPSNDLVKAISEILKNDFVGTINIGSDRKSDFAKFKEFKSSLKPCKLKDIAKALPYKMASDASLDISLWKKLPKQNET